MAHPSVICIIHFFSIPKDNNSHSKDLDRESHITIYTIIGIAALKTNGMNQPAWISNFILSKITVIIHVLLSSPFFPPLSLVFKSLLPMEKSQHFLSA